MNDPYHLTKSQKMKDLDSLFKSPKFGPSFSNILKVFDDSSSLLNNQLKSSQPINKFIDDFINHQYEKNKNSDYYNELLRYIETMNLAAEELWFTLTPLVARYNQKSYENHLLPSLIGDDKEFDHVFIVPKIGVEGFYYNYYLYIPIPKDLLINTSPKILVKEHWNLIKQKLEIFSKIAFIKNFEPKCIIPRVYGWEGAWIGYTVSVLDDGLGYWSLPLVKTPYNGCQPFLAIKEGEFAIMQDDQSENCHKKTKDACAKIKLRIKQKQDVEFETKKSIEVAPKWITAHAINSNPKPMSSLSQPYEDFSSKICSSSLKKDLNSTEKILDFMKKSTMGKPVYIFEEDDIGDNRIY
jgi:hypothetical protein